MRPLVPSQMIQSYHLPRATGVSQEPRPPTPHPRWSCPAGRVAGTPHRPFCKSQAGAGAT